MIASNNALNDFSPDVFGYDVNNNEINDLGIALRDIIKQTEDMDGADGAGDEEKKVLRQRELLKQGTVFVQDVWLRCGGSEDRAPHGCC